MNNDSNTSTITVQHKLGQGKFSVYYVDCPARNTGYALKIFPKQLNGTLQYHKERVIARLDHPNIIQYVHIQCNTADFDGLVTEYAPYGDLFEWMMNGNMENEMIIRSYFHQMIEGVEYLHGQNVAHLDLKLENLMIGEDFQLKIIDFDQAQSLKDMWITSGGTKCYRAPEILNKTCQDFTLADIYSIGVTIYALMTKEFPFLEGDDSENGFISSQYRVFLEDNKRFWGSKRVLKGRKGCIGEEFIELMNGMLERDPMKRWNVDKIKKSRWYNGPVLDYEGLKNEMNIRWEQIMRKKNKKQVTRAKKDEMELE